MLAFSFHEACGTPDVEAVLSVTGTTSSWNARGMGGDACDALWVRMAARFPPLRESRLRQDRTAFSKDMVVTWKNLQLQVY